MAGASRSTNGPTTVNTTTPTTTTATVADAANTDDDSSLFNKEFLRDFLRDVEGLSEDGVRQQVRTIFEHSSVSLKQIESVVVAHRDHPDNCVQQLMEAKARMAFPSPAVVPQNNATASPTSATGTNSSSSSSSRRESLTTTTTTTTSSSTATTTPSSSSDHLSSPATATVAASSPSRNNLVEYSTASRDPAPLNNKLFNNTNGGGFPQGMLLPKSDIDCRYGLECYTIQCPFKHPPGHVPKQRPTAPCKYGLQCDNVSCKYAHPPGFQRPCRYHDACSRPDCRFRHPRDTMSIVSPNSYMMMSPGPGPGMYPPSPHAYYAMPPPNMPPPRMQPAPMPNFPMSPPPPMYVYGRPPFGGPMPIMQPMPVILANQPPPPPLEVIHVLWDVDVCSVPPQMNSKDIVEIIRDRFRLKAPRPPLKILCFSQHKTEKDVKESIPNGHLVSDGKLVEALKDFERTKSQSAVVIGAIEEKLYEVLSQMGSRAMCVYDATKQHPPSSVLQRCSWHEVITTPPPPSSARSGGKGGSKRKIQ